MPEQLTPEQIAERREYSNTYNHICHIEGIKVTDEMKADMELFITGKMNINEHFNFIKKNMG